METLIFKITPWSNPKVWRTIEVVSSQSLFDLHQAISDILRYEPGHLHAFYLNGNLRDLLFAYGDSSSERSSRAMSFRELEPPLNKSWLYVYDFGAKHMHDVQLVARGQLEPGGGYPRVLEGEGDLHAEPEKAPPLAPEAAAELAEILPELRSVVERFYDRLDAEEEGRDVGPVEPSEVRRERELGLKLLDLCCRDRFLIEQHVERVLELQVREWLYELPGVLGDVDLYSWAVDLAERLLPLGEKRLVHYRLPFWLLGKGDEAAARERVEENLKQYPQDYKVLCFAAQDLMRIGDSEGAEKCFLEGFRWVGTDWFMRIELAEGFTSLLTEQGREQEVDELRESEAVFERKARGANRLVGGPSLQPHGKKVGRNDPCPCASGKKYKKCCGKAA